MASPTCVSVDLQCLNIFPLPPENPLPKFFKIKLLFPTQLFILLAACMTSVLVAAYTC